jgi:hypothetical protein
MEIRMQDIRAGADNLMRLASTSEGAEVGKSIPDPLFRLEDKKPEDGKDYGGNA